MTYVPLNLLCSCFMYQRFIKFASLNFHKAHITGCNNLPTKENKARNVTVIIFYSVLILSLIPEAGNNSRVVLLATQCCIPPFFTASLIYPHEESKVDV